MGLRTVPKELHMTPAVPEKTTSRMDYEFISSDYAAMDAQH